MISIPLFYCCEKVFILMNMLMIGKNSIKHHYLKKKILVVTLKWNKLLMQIACTQKDFIKILKQAKLGECHDLYVESDTLLLTDVFEDFQNVCLEIGELDPTRFLTAAGLEWQAALTKTKVKDLLADISLLLMVEKGVGGGLCHFIY